MNTNSINCQWSQFRYCGQFTVIDHLRIPACFGLRWVCRVVNFVALNNENIDFDKHTKVKSSKLTLICPFGVSGGIQVTTIVEDDSGRTSIFLGADSISKGSKFMINSNSFETAIKMKLGLANVLLTRTFKFTLLVKAYSKNWQERKG